MKRAKYLFLILTTVIVFITNFSQNYLVLNEEEKIVALNHNLTAEQSQPSKIIDGNLKVYIFDVGQADAILLDCDGKFILIDAGKNSDGDMIVEYLKKLNVRILDYVIVTHKHADHIGGMDNVIYNFPINNLYMTEYTSSTKTYKDFINALNYKNIQVTYPEKDVFIELDNLKINIFIPKKLVNNLNNNSLVVKISYGDFDMLFTGDMEKPEEIDLIKREDDLDVDILKVGHHGSKTSTTDEFIKTVKPEYAIISVGENNQYHHPDQEVIDKLKENKVKIYRTDENGNILIETNGSGIKVFSEK